eukprot:13879-Amphidinium_carterae.1
MHVIAPASRLPWSLCVGDLAANVQVLQAAEEPHERVSQQLYQLLHIGVNEAVICEALQLMGECSWTSASVERQHGSGAVLKKYHSEAATRTLLLRSYMHGINQLLPTTHESKPMQALQRRLRSITNSRPTGLTGRHVFLQDALARAAVRTQRRGGDYTYSRHTVFRIHGSEWHALTPAERHNYQKRAAAMHTARTAKRTEALTRVILELQQQVRAKDANGEPVGSMLLRSSQFGQAWMDRLLHIHTEELPKKIQCSRNFDSACACPEPLSREKISSLQKGSKLQPPQSKDLSHLWKEVCRHRDFFKDAVFRITIGEDVHHYRFVFACQRPFGLELLEVQEIDTERTVFGPRALHDAELHIQATWLHFAHTAAYVSAADIDIASSSDVGVHLSSRFEGLGKLLVEDVCFPLQTLVEATPPRVTRIKREKPAASPFHDSDNNSIDEADELDASDAETVGRSECMEDADDDASDSASSTESTSSSTADEVQALFDELEARRSEWENDACSAEADYRLSLCGGNWSLERNQEAIAEVRVDVRRGSVTATFCETSGVAKSATFELSKYSQAIATQLAKVFMHRLSFLVQEWAPGELLSINYSPAVLARYTEPDFVQALRADCTPMQ